MLCLVSTEDDVKQCLFKCCTDNFPVIKACNPATSSAASWALYEEPSKDEIKDPEYNGADQDTLS